MTFTPLQPGERIRNGDYRRLKSEAGEWEKIDSVFGDCRVDPESSLEYARATSLNRSPEELTAVIERICSKSDWFRSVWLHVNGYPVLMCRREPTNEEKDSVVDEFHREGICAFDYKVIPEIQFLKPEECCCPEPPSLPPGVSFCSITGALTITEGSTVKRVVVPDGMEVTVPGEGVLHVIYKGNKTIHIHRS